MTKMTKKEAENYRYGSWAGNEKGEKFCPECCAYEVYPAKGSWAPYQCLREPGYGPDKLYCKQHAKKFKPAL